jgi:hypothetical protein
MPAPGKTRITIRIDTDLGSFHVTVRDKYWIAQRGMV